jgi:hypothetical protein
LTSIVFHSIFPRCKTPKLPHVTSDALLSKNHGADAPLIRLE